MKIHNYTTQLRWTGNLGEGTRNYRVYSRDHEILVSGKTDTIFGSSDPGFRGDPSRYNPEELLVAALSACHMLWYLHLCSVNKIVVTNYEDAAEGSMAEEDDGGGQFSAVTLKPVVTVAERSMTKKASALHAEAHRMCFIARSVNFPVGHEDRVVVDTAG